MGLPTPTLHQIIEALHGGGVDPGQVHVASFPGDPHNKDDAKWHGFRWGGGSLHPDYNNFICMGLLEAGTTGRSLTLVRQHTGFWMDDVGTKVPLVRVEQFITDTGLEPTLVIETSPGNFSYFWRFRVAVPEDGGFSAQTVAAIRHRLKIDGWGDPAAQDAARYMRLAPGINGKAAYQDPLGQPFRTRVVLFDPGADVALGGAAYGLMGADWHTEVKSGQFAPARVVSGLAGNTDRAATMDDPLVKLAAQIGLQPQPSTRAGVIDCRCPNEAAHTGGDPTGYAIINDGMSYCNHASCQHLRSVDFRDMMVEKYEQDVAAGLMFGTLAEEGPGAVKDVSTGEVLPRTGMGFLAGVRFADADTGHLAEVKLEAAHTAERIEGVKRERAATVEALARDLIHVDSAEAFWHRTKHILMTPSRLDRDEDVLGVFALVGGDKRASVQLLNSGMIEHVETLAQAPGGGDIVDVVLGGKTVRAVNTYLPSSVGRRPGTPQKFLDHIHHLFGDQPEIETYLIEALAWYVQNPGSPTSVILLLGGEPGIGKDFILSQLFRIVGEHNVAQATLPDLLGSFNQFLLSPFISLGEFSMADAEGRRAYNRLKALTSQGEVPMSINRKYMKPVDMLVRPRFIATTNDEDALSGVDTEDRRFLVGWSNARRPDGGATGALSGAYFDDLWAHYADPANLEVLHDYLATLPIKVFDPHKAPPRSEAGHQTLVSSLQSASRYVYDLMTEGEFAKRRVVSFSEVERAALAADNPNVKRFVSQRSIREGMRMAGSVSIQTRVSMDGQRVRLWTGSVEGGAITKTERSDLLALGSRMLAKEYEADLKGVSKGPVKVEAPAEDKPPAQAELPF